MPETGAHHLLIPNSRRKFLTQLGVLAGVGVCAPLLRRAFPGRKQRFELGRPALGTWVRLVIEDEDTQRANRALEDAFDAIKRVDALMSIHRPDSQLAKVNNAAGIGAVKVHQDVFKVVEMACGGAARTQDVYDPTILPLMKLYGFYDSGNKTYPSDKQISTTLELLGHGHVQLDRIAGTIALNKRGAALDLGSIGKGWALDRAVDAIRAHGVTCALVDVGGNCYALGAPQDSEGWAVGVVHPDSGAIVRTLHLRDRAIATSANNEQFQILGQVRVGHLFDAQLGRPSNGHLSATVLAKTGVESDMLSTIAFLLGPERVRKFPGLLESHFIG